MATSVPTLPAAMDQQPTPHLHMATIAAAGEPEGSRPLVPITNGAAAAVESSAAAAAAAAAAGGATAATSSVASTRAAIVRNTISILQAAQLATSMQRGEPQPTAAAAATVPPAAVAAAAAAAAAAATAAPAEPVVLTPAARRMAKNRKRLAAEAALAAGEEPEKDDTPHKVASKARARKVPKSTDGSSATGLPIALAPSPATGYPPNMELFAAQFQSYVASGGANTGALAVDAATAASRAAAGPHMIGGPDANMLSLLPAMRPTPYLTPTGLFMSEADPFGTETPSAIKFPTWQQLDDFIKMLSIRNGFRHVLRRSHKDDKHEYRHGTYVCEFHASPTDLPPSAAGPARASSRSVRLSCPYKINFARQGEAGFYHVNKRVMQHSHVIPDTNIGSMMPAMGVNGAAMMNINLSLMQSAAGLGPGAQLPQMPPSTLAVGAAAGLGPATSAAASFAAAAAATAAAASGAPHVLGAAAGPNALGQAKSEPLAAASVAPRAPNLKRLLASPEQEEPPMDASNAISAACDHLASLELVRTLRECDAQIFNGYGGLPGLYDRPCLDAVAQLTGALRRAMQLPCKVIISGEGTFGRLAWSIAAHWNQVAQEGGGRNGLTFSHICAGRTEVNGGDSALSSTAAEDDADLGRRDLKAQMAGQANVVFIGLAPSLTTPYIAGQLDYCMQLHAMQAGGGEAGSLHTALIGFNQAYRSRETIIDRWDAAEPSLQVGPKTFRSTLIMMEQLTAAESAQQAGLPPAFTMVLPVVGPEFLAASSRMKATSTTMLLLDSIFATALNAHDATQPHEFKAAFIRSVSTFENVWRQTHLQGETIAQLVDTASRTLAKTLNLAIQALPASTSAPALPLIQTIAPYGRIFNVSFSQEIGRMAFVDAGDNYVTFGTPERAVNSFWAGGLTPGLSTLTIFRDVELPKVTAKDTIIVYMAAEDLSTTISEKGWQEADSLSLVQAMVASGATLAAVHISSGETSHPLLKALQAANKVESTFPTLLDVPLDSSVRNLAAAFAGKLVLNAINTLGHIRAGYTLSNRCVNMAIVSCETYARAIDIIRDLTSVSGEVAEVQLLRAIYTLDSIDPTIRQAKIGAHVRMAEIKAATFSAAGSCTVGILPVALMLAECESSRLPVPAPLTVAAAASSSASTAGSAAATPATPTAPAITIAQATRRLQTSSFKQIMQAKYSANKRPETAPEHKPWINAQGLIIPNHATSPMPMDDTE